MNKESAEVEMLVSDQFQIWLIKSMIKNVERGLQVYFCLFLSDSILPLKAVFNRERLKMIEIEKIIL